MILHEKTKAEFGVEFGTAVNRDKFYCVCDYCGKEFVRTKRSIVDSNAIVSKDSCAVGKCKRAKGEESQLIKYGVKNVGGSEENNKKKRATNLERYGAEHYQHTEEYRTNNLEKYGCEYPMQNSEVKDKVKKTRLDNSGYDHHTKSPEYQAKLRQKYLEKYGVSHFAKTDEFKEKLRNAFLEKYGVDSFFKSEQYQEIIRDKYDGNTNWYGKSQKEIRAYMLSLGWNFVPNRTLLEGKEIDLYNDELKIGIEYCGLFWHHELSLQPRTRSYHTDKYLKCKEKGVRLVTIFEDEWKKKRAQCEGVLASIVGKTANKFYARKCLLKILSGDEIAVFCRSHHLRGEPKRSLFGCGLFFGDELLGVMSLGPHHRGTSTLVLNRLCFKPGVQVIGGAGKLLSSCKGWALENNYSKIITWSDHRWSSGGVYSKTGFVADGELPPDYSYVLTKGGKVVRLSKQSCRKSAKNCPPGKTEREWMAELGYARIWDCGKTRWVLDLKG